MSYGEEAIASSLAYYRNFKMSDIKIEEVIKRHTDELLAVSGVVGVAEGKSRGKQCIRIFVIDIKSESLKVLPDNLEGYSVNIEESGDFQALTT